MITPRDREYADAATGELRGAALKTDERYIKKNGGNEALSKIETLLQSWKHPIDYSSIKKMQWIPATTRVYSLLAIRELFNLDDTAVYEMGCDGAKFSFIVRIMTKFIKSSTGSIEAVQKNWSSFFSIGSLEVSFFDIQTQNGSVIIRHINMHPIFCLYLAGFFSTLLQNYFPGKHISVTETKCSFQGDAYHEYTMHWE